MTVDPVDHVTTIAGPKRMDIRRIDLEGVGGKNVVETEFDVEEGLAAVISTNRVSKGLAVPCGTVKIKERHRKAMRGKYHWIPTITPAVAPASLRTAEVGRGAGR